MNEEMLLPYTKITKNLVQDVFHINLTQQTPERMSCRPQMFRDEFLPPRLHTAVQRSDGFAQQCALALPADQPGLVRAEIALREPHNGRHQFLDPVAPRCRNLNVPAAATPPHCCPMRFWHV